MVEIGKRIKNGQEEIIVYNINDDLNGLIDAIDKIREDDPFGMKPIFIIESLMIDEQIIDRDIKFFDCIFEKEVNFIGTTFNKKVDFKNSILQSDTSFINVEFHKQSDFREVEFQRDIEFQHIEFLEYADFSNANFQSKTEFNYINFQEGGSFDEIHFQGETSFLEVIFKQNTGFWNTNFQNPVEFNEVDFQDGFSFEDINFQGETYFSEVRFKGRGIFGDINFQDKVKFIDCEFHYSIFINIIFNKSVDFLSSTFQFLQTFGSTNFMDTANFSNTTFEQEVMFTDCKVDSKTLISFQCATFKKGLDISTSNFNLCKLNFLGIRIENINEALSSGFYNIKDKNNLQYLSPHQRLRETFRFIKNSLYAENNQIEGLEFHKKEMEVYEKELESKGDEYWQEKMILWFNKISNNYGTSWLRGVGFTAVWALVILGIILGITTLENSGIIFNLCDLDAWKQTIKAYIEIINIAKWTDIEPLECKLSGFGLFFLFVGRIFIGYGYYQTIQAFRKYGK